MTLKTLEVVSYKSVLNEVDSREQLYASKGNAYHTAFPAVDACIGPPDFYAENADIAGIATNGEAFAIHFADGVLSAHESYMLKLADCRVKGGCGTVFLDEHVALGESYHDTWVFERITAPPYSHLRIPVTLKRGEQAVPLTVKVYDDPGAGPAFPHTPCIVMASRWADNYCHWLLEVLSRFWYLDAYPELRNLPVVLPAIDKRYQRETLAAIGVADRCIQYKAPVAHFDSFYFPSFAAPGAYSRRQLDWLQGTLFRAYGIQPSGKPERRIYVSRRKARARHVLNETELEALLHRHGFETVLLDDASVEEQLRIFSEASIVVSPHGAANVNLVFMPAGSTFIELMPDTSKHPMYWIIAKLKECRYGILSCRDTGLPRNDLTVDLDKMATVLRQALS